MKKGVIIIIVVVVLVGGGLTYWYSTQQGSSNSAPAPYQNQTPAPTPNPTPVPNPTPNPATNPNQALNPVPASAIIRIGNFAFSPATLTIHKGTTVTWTNNDTTPHTVTGDNGGPASPALSQGATYNYTFNTVGSFPYHCSFHPSMQATVQVTN